MSEAKRQFYLPGLAAAAEGSELALPVDEARHAAKVLRMRVGDEVGLFDGVGGVSTGELSAVAKRDVRVRLGKVRFEERRGRRVELAFAVPKGKRLDWLLEKSAELACTVLQPVRLERSVAGESSFSENKRERWLDRCIAACKQSGGAWLPELREPVALSEYLAECDADVRWLGEAAGTARPLGPAVAEVGPGEAVALLVGPEGGLTDGESATAATAGFVAVRVGHTTLRVETACVAMLAAVRAAEGG
jgi:16S rRNA (uracil1498-N3)-methyltransferase